jgi:hypothetical protein
MKKSILAIAALCSATDAQSADLCFMAGIGQKPVNATAGIAAIGTLETNRFTALCSTPIREIFGNPGLFAETFSVGGTNCHGQKLWLALTDGQGNAGMFSGPDWRLPTDPNPLGTALFTTDTLTEARAGRITDTALVLESPGTTPAATPAALPALWTAKLVVFQFTDVNHPELGIPVATNFLPQYAQSTNSFYRLQIGR